jgi:hypothetical protein
LAIVLSLSLGTIALADDIAEGRQRLYTEQARAHSVVDAWELGEED